MSEFDGQSLSVALVSDTHGHLDPRVAAIVARCDLAVHAGDVGGMAVLAALRPRLGRVIAVRGNNDTPREWPVAESGKLENLPRQAALDLPGGQLVVIHGHRSGPLYERHHRLRRRFPEARAIVVGHSHHQECDCSSVPWVLNPGAAGRYRTFGRPGCLVLLVSEGSWEIEVHRLLPRRRGSGRRGARRAAGGREARP